MPDRFALIVLFSDLHHDSRHIPNSHRELLSVRLLVFSSFRVIDSERCHRCLLCRRDFCGGQLFLNEPRIPGGFHLRFDRCLPPNGTEPEQLLFRQHCRWIVWRRIFGRWMPSRRCLQRYLPARRCCLLSEEPCSDCLAHIRPLTSHGSPIPEANWNLNRSRWVCVDVGRPSLVVGKRCGCGYPNTAHLSRCRSDSW